VLLDDQPRSSVIEVRDGALIRCAGDLVDHSVGRFDELLGCLG
jgi:hypothetical protein